MIPDVLNPILAGSSLVLLLTCTGLGVRLLWLTRSRAEASERWLAAGLILLSALTFPLLRASGLGVVPVGEVRMGLLGAGLTAMLLSVWCLATFTRRVFRAEGWQSLACVAGIVGTMLVAAVACVFILSTADPHQGSREALWPWGLLLRAPLLLVWAWTALDALSEWRRALRRVTLGLSEPVVANRFLLWGMVGAFQLTAGFLSLGLQVVGRSPLNDPTAVGITVSSSIVSSTLLMLALCPPAFYVRWVGSAESAA